VSHIVLWGRYELIRIKYKFLTLLVLSDRFFRSWVVSSYHSRVLKECSVFFPRAITSIAKEIRWLCASVNRRRSLPKKEKEKKKKEKEEEEKKEEELSLRRMSNIVAV